MFDDGQLTKDNIFAAEFADFGPPDGGGSLAGEWSGDSYQVICTNVQPIDIEKEQWMN
jgi:hypothetical protein